MNHLSRDNTYNEFRFTITKYTSELSATALLISYLRFRGIRNFFVHFFLLNMFRPHFNITCFIYTNSSVNMRNIFTKIKKILSKTRHSSIMDNITRRTAQLNYYFFSSLALSCVTF